jgi:CDP-glucose 4,6-dehydratase
MTRQRPFAAMSGLFGGAYEGRRVLVTGHTGFKGSWLVLWLQSMGAHVTALSLDAGTTPSHHALLSLQLAEAHVDIRDAAALRDAMQQFAPEMVFHLAAQSLVRRGYAEPTLTFDVNVMGLVHVLEAVRATQSVRAMLNVTTDKCYRQRIEPSLPFAEGDALGGHDPYSASKACAEIVSETYRQSFLTAARSNDRHVALATARAGNVIGGGDWSADRLVPDLARAANEGRALAVRNPRAVRPWQHVLEPLAGYLLLGQQLLQAPHFSMRFSDAFNFGPDAAGHLTVSDVIAGCAKHWDAVRSLEDTDDHPHEAEVLRLDCSKARAALCWRPLWTSETLFERTANWYRAWYERGVISTRDDLYAYVRDAQDCGLTWAQA